MILSYEFNILMCSDNQIIVTLLRIEMKQKIAVVFQLTDSRNSSKRKQKPWRHMY